MLPQNQPPMMPSMHYSQMAQPEIGQDLWDHEKHVSFTLHRIFFYHQNLVKQKFMKAFYLNLFTQSQGWNQGWTN